MKNLHYDNFQIVFNNLEMKMLEHGHLYADKNWNPYEPDPPFNRLYLILDGEGYLETEQQERIYLKKNMAYLIPQHINYSCACEKYLEKFYIHFQLNYLPGHDLFEFNTECLQFPMESESIHNLMLLAQSNLLTDKLLFKSYILELLVRFVQNTEINYNQINTYILYRNIFEYVENNCHSDLDITKIAQYVQMNINTLRISFKKDMGITLKHYIDLKIIERAKEDLIYSRLSLKEIAFKYRFNDEFYFSRFFKKQVGTSPKQYKVNHFINGIHEVSKFRRKDDN